MGCLARVVSPQHGRSIGAEKLVMTKHASTQHAEVLEDGTRTGKETVYVLGHSQDEIGRLIDQAAIIRPTTERLLRSAGIERGMHVLDLGCGAGDVSMLAGKLVGPSGSVLGIDPQCGHPLCCEGACSGGRTPACQLYRGFCR